MRNKTFFHSNNIFKNPTFNFDYILLKGRKKYEFTKKMF